MENYLIHTCSKRKWYVEKYLIPSMIEQGCKNIIVYSDDTNDGNLRSFLKSYNSVKGKDAWHLQDDIIISSNFREMTEKYNRGIVCGFCNSFSKGQPGRTNVWNMWYSMPCIRIPAGVFTAFIDWMNERDTQVRYRHYFEDNKHDDVFFQSFLQERQARAQVLNLAPNIVNHIDHLLGGSLVNKDRRQETSYIMSKYWDEPELLDDIEQKLKERRAV